MQKEIYSQGQIVSVLTTQPVNGLLDYSVFETEVKLGQYIVVPFGKREIVGIVWGDGVSNLNKNKIKKISRILPVPKMENKFRKFLIEVARFNICSLNQVLKLTFLDITSLSNFKSESFFSFISVY